MPKRWWSLVAVARFSPGHDQRVGLSSVSAIADMIAPVVLITLATIFANGLMAASGELTGAVLALYHERLGILRGPHGEMLEEDSVPPVDRERLSQIRALTSRMIKRIRRIRRIRTAIVIIWIAVGLLVLSVAAIAVAVTANSEAFGFPALALVLAGVAGVFAGIATVIVSMARPTNSPVETVGRIGVHG